MIDRVQVYKTIYTTKLVPLFYHHDLARASDIVNACIAGGRVLLSLLIVVSKP